MKMLKIVLAISALGTAALAVAHIATGHARAEGTATGSATVSLCTSRA